MAALVTENDTPEEDDFDVGKSRESFMMAYTNKSSILLRKEKKNPRSICLSRSELTLACIVASSSRLCSVCLMK